MPIKKMYRLRLKIAFKGTDQLGKYEYAVF